MNYSYILIYHRLKFVFRNYNVTFHKIPGEGYCVKQLSNRQNNFVSSFSDFWSIVGIYLILLSDSSIFDDICIFLGSDNRTYYVYASQVMWNRVIYVSLLRGDKHVFLFILLGQLLYLR